MRNTYTAHCRECSYEAEYAASVLDPQCIYGCGTMLIVCPECGREVDDDRTRSGMKCGRCAY